MMNTVFEIIGMGSKKYGGFEKYIVEEARQLKDKGYRLVVIFDRQPLATEYVTDLENLGGVVEVLPQTSWGQFAKGFVVLLKKYRPKVVHTNFSSNMFVALPLSWLYGVRRRIGTEHCLPSFSGLRGRMVAQLMTIVAQKMLPVSNKSTECLKKAMWLRKNRVETLYLGVEDFPCDRSHSREKLGIKDDEVALMCIAYHNPVKGVDVLVDAMNIIVNEYGVKSLRLWQIGGGQTGKDTEYLHELAHKYGLDGYIVWMGIRNDVPEILPAGDIYVQPSRSEGISLSNMEASIASIPLVVTNVGGMPEVAIENENAFVVPSENPRALADAIVKLYSDKELRVKMGECGRKMALEKFCLANNVTRLIDRYYKL